jgi:hypothetical protein
MAYGHKNSDVMYDAEPATLLRDGKDALENADAAEAPIKLKPENGISWDEENQTFRNSAVQLHVTQADAGGTYAVAVEVSADEAFTAPVVVGSVAVTKAGVYKVMLNAGTIEMLAPDAKYIRTNATVSGGNLGYYAWMVNTRDNAR